MHCRRTEAQSLPEGIPMPEVTVEEVRRFTRGVPGFEEEGPVPIFRGLNSTHLTKIAQITRRRPFAPDKDVFQEGNDGDETFLLLSGTVRVTKALPHWKENRAALGEVEIIQIPAEWNPSFGELALFNSQASRTARLSGVEAGELGVISSRDFLSLVEDDHDIGYYVLKNVLAKQMNTIRVGNENVLNLANMAGWAVDTDMSDTRALEDSMEGGDAYIREFMKELATA